MGRSVDVVLCQGGFMLNVYMSSSSEYFGTRVLSVIFNHQSHETLTCYVHSISFLSTAVSTTILLFLHSVMHIVSQWLISLTW